MPHAAALPLDVLSPWRVASWRADDGEHRELRPHCRAELARTATRGHVVIALVGCASSTVTHSAQREPLWVQRDPG